MYQTKGFRLRMRAVMSEDNKSDWLYIYCRQHTHTLQPCHNHAHRSEAIDNPTTAVGTPPDAA
jgi:hypothetical protein